MKKVLLVGNGGREHVIAETLMRSTYDVQLYGYGTAKNPGIDALAQEYRVGSLSDFSELIAFAQEVKPDFAFIGPDNPIADGCADALLKLGIKSVAPLAALARVESSKAYARELIEQYNIPGNPKFRNFSSEDGVMEFLAELGDDYVVKGDGLAGGKGVKVSGDHLNSHEEAMDFVRACLEKDGRVVIEEKFVGVEFSLMHFSDGETVVDMPAVQDHKRAYDGDKGPNTGGMGSYSDANHSLPFLTEQDLKDAHDISAQMIAALKKDNDGQRFTGILFGGFIATKVGVRLIEFNARFGDPESMNVLPLLKTDFVDLCEAIINGNLNQIDVEFENKATVCQYVVPEGYPDNPKANQKIEIGELPEGIKTYYSSVDKREDGIYMTTSRAVAFVGIADTISQANTIATQGLSAVSGPIFYRKDIGTDALVKERIEVMRGLRA